MDCSMLGLPVHHQLLEFTQTHVHWVSDAIQPSHPLSSPSPVLNLSQHQGLYKWVILRLGGFKHWYTSQEKIHEKAVTWKVQHWLHSICRLCTEFHNVYFKCSSLCSTTSSCLCCWRESCFVFSSLISVFDVWFLFPLWCFWGLLRVSGLLNSVPRAWLQVFLLWAGTQWAFGPDPHSFCVHRAISSEVIFLLFPFFWNFSQEIVGPWTAL